MVVRGQLETITKYKVVPNAVYKHVFTKYKDAIRSHVKNPDAMEKQLQLGAEGIGDTMEISFAFMWFQSEADAIWRLMELLEWEYQHFQRGSLPIADKRLKQVREWKPAGGGRTSDTLPTPAEDERPKQEEHVPENAGPIVEAVDWGSSTEPSPQKKKPQQIQTDRSQEVVRTAQNRKPQKFRGVLVPAREVPVE